jgi:hypothetical protein
MSHGYPGTHSTHTLLLPPFPFNHDRQPCGLSVQELHCTLCATLDTVLLALLGCSEPCVCWDAAIAAFQLRSASLSHRLVIPLPPSLAVRAANQIFSRVIGQLYQLYCILRSEALVGVPWALRPPLHNSHITTWLFLLFAGSLMCVPSYSSCRGKCLPCGVHLSCFQVEGSYRLVVCGCMPFGWLLVFAGTLVSLQDCCLQGIAGTLDCTCMCAIN